MVNKLAKFIANHPKIIFLVATLLLIPSAIGYFNTFVNYDIMSYLPDSIHSVQGEEILDEDFGHASDAFLVIENMSSKDIVELKSKISEVEGVYQVTWVDDIADISIPQSVLPDALTDIFYSSDGSSTLLMVQFNEGSATESTMNAIKEIKTLLNKQCFLSGMSAIVEDTKSLADSETPKYVAVAVVLALIALSFTMDSWVLPLVILASLGYAILYNMGTNIFMPNGISYITKCIAAVLQLAVTMDYSVFLLDRFNEELKKNPNRNESMAVAIAATFQSLLGSSLTTVFGFLALCFMSFTLGLDIGIVMAKGVIFGILTVVIVLPAFILIFYKGIYRFKHKRFLPSFNALNKFTIKHRKVLAIIFIALIIPSYIAKSFVSLDYNVANALPEQLDSVQSLSKLKKDFNMSTTHFVIIHDDIPSGQVSEMISEFEDVDGISNIISLNSFVGPAISNDILPDSVKELCMKDGYQLMMINSVYTSSSDEANAQIEEIEDILYKYDPDGYLTGEGPMSKDLISVTDKDFKVTSIISIAAIFILIAILFKSISIPVLLVAAIELAIFINEAFPLVTGADVSFIAPTVISCVQLGATVDYAILLTTRFREELRTGKSRKEAMLVAANASDQSIFQSALVFFCATFGVYVVCNIEIVSSLCGMLARGAAISAIVIILFLTPVLVAFEGLIDKTSYKWNPNKNKNDESEGEKKTVKTSNAKSIIKKTIAVGTALTMLFSFAACGSSSSDDTTTTSATETKTQAVYTDTASSVTKNETVYVNIDNKGTVKEVQVTDWLHTDKSEVCVNDVSNLKNITNIKTDVEPVIDGENIQWNMPDTDLYYSGTSDSELPVQFQIKYYLDGKEISADDIAGQSGKVKIEVNMTNNCKKTVKINGKKSTVYLPVMVVGGLIMQESEFSGVSVEGGRAIGDGTKEIVAFFGMPGMSESLGLKDLGITNLDGLVIGSTASVTADAKDFELGNMYFAVIPIASLNLNVDAGDSMSDLKSVLSALSEVQDAISKLDTNKLMDMLQNKTDGVASLTSVMSDAVELYNSNKALIDVLSKYATPTNSEQLEKLLKVFTSEDAKKAISLLSDSSVVNFLADLADLGDTIPIASSLAKDLQNEDVQKALENLPETLEKLSEIQKTLDDNSELIDTFMSLLSDDTMDTITSLMSLAGTADFASLEEKYSSLASNADVIVDKMEKWIDFGKEYKIFTEATDDMDTSVMFIYMTPSISKEVTAEETTTDSSNESILDSFIQKFKK